MKNLFYITLSLLFCFYSCEVETDLKSALKLAGDNKKELESVLSYYANEEKDSLKLKAAKFLISNMPIYYSYDGDSLDNFKQGFVTAIKNGYTGKSALEETQRTVGFPVLNQLRMTKDIEVIKAEYIIENIEHSFRVWQEQPWGKHISLEDFCEYVLPYRIENEPLENWKEKYYQQY